MEMLGTGAFLLGIALILGGAFAMIGFTKISDPKDIESEEAHAVEDEERRRRAAMRARRRKALQLFRR